MSWPPAGDDDRSNSNAPQISSLTAGQSGSTKSESAPPARPLSCLVRTLTDSDSESYFSGADGRGPASPLNMNADNATISQERYPPMNASLYYNSESKDTASSAQGLVAGSSSSVISGVGYNHRLARDWREGDNNDNVVSSEQQHDVKASEQDNILPGPTNHQISLQTTSGGMGQETPADRQNRRTSFLMGAENGNDHQNGSSTSTSQSRARERLLHTYATNTIQPDQRQLTSMRSPSATTHNSHESGFSTYPPTMVPSGSTGRSFPVNNMITYTTHTSSTSENSTSTARTADVPDSGSSSSSSQIKDFPPWHTRILGSLGPVTAFVANTENELRPLLQDGHRSNTIFIRPIGDVGVDSANCSVVETIVSEEDREWIEKAKELGLWKDKPGQKGYCYDQLQGPILGHDRWELEQQFYLHHRMAMLGPEQEHEQRRRVQNGGCSTNSLNHNLNFQANAVAGPSGSSSSSSLGASSIPGGSAPSSSYVEVAASNSFTNTHPAMPPSNRRKLAQNRADRSTPDGGTRPSKRARGESNASDIEVLSDPLRQAGSSSTTNASAAGGGSELALSGALTSEPESKPAPVPLPAPPPKPKWTSEPLAEFVCPICFSPPTNATLTPCGHVCCGECLFMAVKVAGARAAASVTREREPYLPRCPVCRAVLKGWDGKGGGVIGLRPRTLTVL